MATSCRSAVNSACEIGTADGVDEGVGNAPLEAEEVGGEDVIETKLNSEASTRRA
jgi:hypothetical protein